MFCSLYTVGTMVYYSTGSTTVGQRALYMYFAPYPVLTNKDYLHVCVYSTPTTTTCKQKFIFKAATVKSFDIDVAWPLFDLR